MARSCCFTSAKPTARQEKLCPTFGLLAAREEGSLLPYSLIAAMVESGSGCKTTSKVGWRTVFGGFFFSKKRVLSSSRFGGLQGKVISDCVLVDRDSRIILARLRQARVCSL